jgi:hypothetical protein
VIGGDRDRPSADEINAHGRKEFPKKFIFS